MKDCMRPPLKPGLQANVTTEKLCQGKINEITYFSIFSLPLSYSFCHFFTLPFLSVSKLDWIAYRCPCNNGKKSMSAINKRKYVLLFRLSSFLHYYITRWFLI